MSEKESNAESNALPGKKLPLSNRVVLIERVGRKFLEEQEGSKCEALVKRTSEEGTVFSINPPPQDGCCEICRKNWRKLEPFGGPGDPLVGDFSGAMLVKKFRPMAPPLSDGEMEQFKREFGEEKASLYDQCQNTIEASWECRECIVLPSKEAHKKKRARAL